MKNSDDFKIDLPRAKMEVKGWGVDGTYGLIDKSGSSHVRIGEVYAYHGCEEDREYRLSVETVKVLYFSKDKKLSLHFHGKKDEIFVCALGAIELETISPSGKTEYRILKPGHRVFIPKFMPHRMKGLEDINILVEVSTHHEDDDSYRIEKGD